MSATTRGNYRNHCGAADERLAATSRLTRLLRRPELGALMGAVVIYVMFAAVDKTGVFATITGTARWTDYAATIGIVAVPVALLMIAGEFDLSSGVMVGTAGLLCGVLTTEYGLSMWPAILLTLPFAACIGLINGWLVMLTGLPSFIVTLAMFFSLQGHQPRRHKAITDTVRVAGIDEVARLRLGAKVFASRSGSRTTTHRGGVVDRHHDRGDGGPDPTRFGNWIYAVGGDENAARNTGVPVRRTKISLFVCTSLAAALVGIISADPAVVDAGRPGRRRGVHLHHRRDRRRVPADRRLRLGHRRQHRRRDHRHGVHRHRLRRLEHRLDLALPRRDPLRRGPGQHLHRQAGGRSEE